MAAARADEAENPLSLGDLAARLEPDGDALVLHGAAGWMQGRTMYGGASSFIAHAAARRLFPDLPPLRAAQIGFVGPVGEDIVASAQMLRSGKSVSHVETTLMCDGALAHRAVWLFGAGRAGNGTVAAEVIDLPILPETAQTVGMHEFAPAFTQRMDMRHALPRGDRSIAIRRWVRLKDRTGLTGEGELIGIGDTLPPGSMRAMERPGPISSINWSLTLLGPVPATREGWWLMETRSNHMADGFSSETLRLWNSDGLEVMRGLQSVAVFG